MNLNKLKGTLIVFTLNYLLSLAPSILIAFLLSPYVPPPFSYTIALCLPAIPSSLMFLHYKSFEDGILNEGLQERYRGYHAAFFGISFIVALPSTMITLIIQGVLRDDSLTHYFILVGVLTLLGTTLFFYFYFLSYKQGEAREWWRKVREWNLERDGWHLTSLAREEAKKRREAKETSIGLIKRSNIGSAKKVNGKREVLVGEGTYELKDASLLFKVSKKNLIIALVSVILGSSILALYWINVLGFRFLVKDFFLEIHHVLYSMADFLISIMGIILLVVGMLFLLSYMNKKRFSKRP